MAIKYFIFSALILAITLLTATITLDNNNVPEKTIKLPLVTFVNSTMYNINTKETTQIIQSKKAFLHNNKDEIFDATIVVRTNLDTNQTVTDTVHSKYIEVTHELLKFRGDVRYDRMDMTSLYSEQMDYDRINHNLLGNNKFTAFHEGNKLEAGTMLIKENKTIFKGENNKPVKLDIILKINKRINNEIN